MTKPTITRISIESFSFLRGCGADLLITATYSEEPSAYKRRRLIRDYCSAHGYRVVRLRSRLNAEATYVCATL